MNQKISSLLQRVYPTQTQPHVRNVPNAIGKRQSQRRDVRQRLTQQERAYASYNPFAVGSSETSQRSGDDAHTRSYNGAVTRRVASGDATDQDVRSGLSTPTRDATHQYSPDVAKAQTPEHESKDNHASSPTDRSFADVAGLKRSNSERLDREDQEVESDSDPAILESSTQHAGTGTSWAQKSTQFDSAYNQLFKLDYRTQLPLALARKEPDLATRCIFAAHNAHDSAFIQSISESDFSAVLKLLKPSSFLHELIDIHYSMKNALVNNFGLTPIDQIAKDYGVVMKQLMDIRHHAGLCLTLADYESILSGAKELQLGGLASRAWYYLFTDGHKPNTKCYNGWIEATSYLGPKSAASRHQERVIPHNMNWRQAVRLNRPIFRFRVGQNGIISDGDKLFADMQRDGIQPDEESYCTLMTVYSLEGKIDGVAAILNNVWKIDMEAVKSGIDQGSPRMLAASDPLRPSKRLLFAATKAYCINNDLPTAVNLLMYICRHYEVEVDEEQWALLTEWIHVLSIRRTEVERREGKAQGMLGMDTMLSLWHTMVSPPYNIQPSNSMFDLLIRNLKLQDNGEEAMLQAMKDGRLQFREQVAIRSERWKDVERLLLDKEATSESTEASIENAVRAWEVAKLRCVRDLNFLRSWLHYFLTRSEHFALNDFDAQRTARDIPKLLWAWRRFVPRIVHYSIPTGHVELVFRSPEESTAHKTAQMAQTAHRQKLLATTAERIDQSWIINYDAPDRIKSQGWQHNQSTDLDHAHKRERGLRRPSDEYLSSMRSVLDDESEEVEDETSDDDRREAFR